MSVDLAALPGLSTRMRELLRERAFLEERHLLESSFQNFVVAAWRFVEPKPLILTRYIEVLCEHMQVFSEGGIELFLIAAPPRSGKSTIISVLYGAWRWTRHPELQFMNITYGQSLSTRDAVKMRRLVESQWYQERWGDKFHIMDDQNTKLKYDNNCGGYRFSASVQGGVLGSGGDEILVDEPHDSENVESDTQRQNVLDFHDNTLTNRMNDQKNFRMLLAMQRLNELDLYGHLEKLIPTAVKLVMPMEFEAERRCTTIVVPSSYPDRWTDWRTQEGELLFPERMGTKEVIREKTKSARSWQAKYQQNPLSETGGVFDADWFKRRYNPQRIGQLMRECEIIQTWDTASKELQTSAYSVCTTIAINGRDGYILDVWRQKVRTDVLETSAIALMQLWSPSTVLIEDKSSGTGLINTLRKQRSDEFGRPIRGGANIIAIGVSPKFDKIKRAEMSGPFWSQGRGWLPDNAPWLAEWMQEHLRFPNVTFADQVDSMSQFVNWFVKLRLHSQTAPATLLSIYQR